MITALLAANGDGGGFGFIIFLIIVVISIISNLVRKGKEAAKQNMPPPSPSQHPQKPATTKRAISLEEFLQQVTGEKPKPPPAAVPKPPPAPAFQRPSAPHPPKPLQPAPIKVSHLVPEAEKQREIAAFEEKKFAEKFDHLRSTIAQDTREFVEEIAIEKETEEFVRENIKPSAKFRKPVAAPYRIKKISLSTGLRLTGETLRQGIILSEIIRPPLSRRRTRSLHR